MYTGVLTKMMTELEEPVNYFLDFNTSFIHMNQLLGQKLQIQFVRHECLNCHLDKPIYRQGFCQSCFFSVPQAADWILHPELSKAHLDQEDRDLEYEKKVQLQPHIVYLANSGSVKVGVTRKSQVPTRWIDQGAHEAIALAEVPNRYLAGVAEVALKPLIADKTNWRKMLRNDLDDLDLAAQREALKPHLPEEILPYFLDHDKEIHIQYPVLSYPEKPNSLNLSKTSFFEGELCGIKGQYLIFRDQTVFNVRAHEGYVIQLGFSKS